MLKLKWNWKSLIKSYENFRSVLTLRRASDLSSWLCARGSCWVKPLLSLKQPPCVFVNKPLTVKQGGAAVITRSVLWVADNDDDPEDVLLLVLDPAQHGHLTRVYDEKPVRHFTLGELGREQLRYIHGGSSQLQDRALLQVNDGHSYQNLLFTIDVENQVRR